MITAATVLAWHGDPGLKTEAVARMRAHREADEFTQRAFVLVDPDKASGYRGCFHGCLTADALIAERGVSLADLANSFMNWHREGEQTWGIPARLGVVLDHMFEALPAEDCAAFAVDATEALPVGADLSQVVDRWTLDLVADPDHGVGRHALGERQQQVVEQVAALTRRRLAGDEPDAAAWRAVRLATNSLTDHVAGAVYTMANDEPDQVATEAAEAAALSGSNPDDARRWQAQRLIYHIATAPTP